MGQKLTKLIFSTYVRVVDQHIWDQMIEVLSQENIEILYKSEDAYVSTKHTLVHTLKTHIHVYKHAHSPHQLEFTILAEIYLKIELLVAEDNVCVVNINYLCKKKHRSFQDFKKYI